MVVAVVPTSVSTKKATLIKKNLRKLSRMMILKQVSSYHSNTWSSKKTITVLTKWSI
jgi:hypothetical protein